MFYSPYIIRVIKSRRMGWDEGVYNTYCGEERCIRGFGGETSENPGVDGRIIYS